MKITATSNKSKESKESEEDEKFCRLTGVKRITFEKMISILKEADVKNSAYCRYEKQRSHLLLTAM
jgi:hypothetical protein